MNPFVKTKPSIFAPQNDRCKTPKNTLHLTPRGADRCRQVQHQLSPTTPPKTCTSTRQVQAMKNHPARLAPLAPPPIGGCRERCERFYNRIPKMKTLPKPKKCPNCGQTTIYTKTTWYDEIVRLDTTPIDTHTEITEYENGNQTYILIGMEYHLRETYLIKTRPPDDAFTPTYRIHQCQKLRSGRKDIIHGT